MTKFAIERLIAFCKQWISDSFWLNNYSLQRKLFYSLPFLTQKICAKSIQRFLFILKLTVLSSTSLFSCNKFLFHCAIFAIYNYDSLRLHFYLRDHASTFQRLILYFKLVVPCFKFLLLSLNVISMFQTFTLYFKKVFHVSKVYSSFWVYGYIL